MARRRRASRRRPTRHQWRGRLRGGAVAALLLLAVWVWGLLAAWWATHGHQVVSVLRWAGPLAAGLLLLGASLIVLSRLRDRAEARTRLQAVQDAVGPRPVRRRGGRNDGRWLEHTVAALYRQDGYLDARVSGGAGDRGLDVSALHPDLGVVVTQCKDYTNPVGSAEMQRFLGTCWDILRVGGQPAEVAVFVTTSTFTEEAVSLASAARQVRGYDRSVLLVDGTRLDAWMRGAWTPLPAPRLTLTLTQEAI